MRSRRRALFAVLPAGLLVVFAGCDGPTGVGFAPEHFDPMPDLAALDWSAVDPAQAWDYWEFRAVGPGLEPLTLGSGGSIDADALDPATREAVAGTFPQAGFGLGCPPGDCRRHIVAIQDLAITVVTDAVGLRSFLGEVTSPEEAIVRISGLDYVWWTDSSATGIRTVGAGWDVVVLELVSHCAPIRVDRVRYRVRPDGRLTEEARELWERSGACI